MERVVTQRVAVRCIAWLGLLQPLGPIRIVRRDPVGQGKISRPFSLSKIEIEIINHSLADVRWLANQNPRKSAIPKTGQQISKDTGVQSGASSICDKADPKELNERGIIICIRAPHGLAIINSNRRGLIDDDRNDASPVRQWVGCGDAH
jgi:hypothetical protein